MIPNYKEYVVFSLFFLILLTSPIYASIYSDKDIKENNITHEDLVLIKKFENKFNITGNVKIDLIHAKNIRSIETKLLTNTITNKKELDEYINFVIKESEKQNSITLFSEKLEEKNYILTVPITNTNPELETFMGKCFYPLDYIALGLYNNPFLEGPSSGVKRDFNLVADIYGWESKNEYGLYMPPPCWNGYQYNHDLNGYNPNDYSTNNNISCKYFVKSEYRIREYIEQYCFNKCDPLYDTNYYVDCMYNCTIAKNSNNLKLEIEVVSGGMFDNGRTQNLVFSSFYDAYYSPSMQEIYFGPTIYPSSFQINLNDYTAPIYLNCYITDSTFNSQYNIYGVDTFNTCMQQYCAQSASCNEGSSTWWNGSCLNVSDDCLMSGCIDLINLDNFVTGIKDDAQTQRRLLIDQIVLFPQSPLDNNKSGYIYNKNTLTDFNVSKNTYTLDKENVISKWLFGVLLLFMGVIIILYGLFYTKKR